MFRQRQQDRRGDRDEDKVERDGMPACRRFLPDRTAADLPRDATGDRPHGERPAVVVNCVLMNTRTRNVIAIVTLVAAAGLPAYGQKSGSREPLPPSVQQALTEAGKGAAVKKVERRTLNGHTIYEVEFEREGASKQRLRVTEDGVIFAGPRLFSGPKTEAATAREAEPVSPFPSEPLSAFHELPAAVRETVKKVAAGRAIVDIDREIWAGRTVYKIEFSEPGLNPQVLIAEDGAVARAEEKAGGRVGTAIRGFFGLKLTDAPAAVQATVRREARDLPIHDLDVKTRQGQRVYEVELGENHTRFELQVAEDGRILHDTRSEKAAPSRK